MSSLRTAIVLRGVSQSGHARRCSPGPADAGDLLDDPGPGCAVSATLKVTVQLLDGGGRLVAQQDLPLTAARALGGGEHLRTYGLALPAELAPGAYRLIAGLYDGAAEGAPRVLTTAGADAVELAVFELGE